MTFLGVIALRNKTVAHTFVQTFDHANSRLFWATWRRTSPLCKGGAKGSRKHAFVSYRKVTKPSSKEWEGREGGKRSTKRTERENFWALYPDPSLQTRYFTLILSRYVIYYLFMERWYGQFKTKENMLILREFIPEGVGVECE